MAENRRGLGRGLSALLGEVEEGGEAAATGGPVDVEVRWAGGARVLKLGR